MQTKTSLFMALVCRRFYKADLLLNIDRYFLAMAVADLCINVTGPFRVFVTIVWGIRIDSGHSALCKISVFVFNVSGATSAYVLVAMTTQRALLVL